MKKPTELDIRNITKLANVDLHKSVVWGTIEEWHTRLILDAYQKYMNIGWDGKNKKLRGIGKTLKDTEDYLRRYKDDER